MDYLYLFSEITAISCASLTINELLSLFESVGSFKNFYWNHQRFWMTIFQLKIGNSIPTNLEDIRNSYISIFEYQEAFLVTSGAGKFYHATGYLWRIGKFNSKILIDDYFENLNFMVDWIVPNCVWSAFDPITPYSELLCAGCHYGHLDLSIDMLARLEKIQTTNKSMIEDPTEINSIKKKNPKDEIYNLEIRKLLGDDHLKNYFNSSKLIGLALSGGQEMLMNFLFDYFEGEIDYGATIRYFIPESSREEYFLNISDSIDPTKIRMFNRLVELALKNVDPPYHIILQGAIYFNNYELFENQIVNLKHHYESVLKAAMCESRKNYFGYDVYSPMRERASSMTERNPTYVQKLLKHHLFTPEIAHEIIGLAIELGDVSFFVSMIDQKLITDIKPILRVIYKYAPSIIDEKMIQFIIDDPRINLDQEAKMTVINRSLRDCINLIISNTKFCIKNSSVDNYCIQNINNLLKLTTAEFDDMKAGIWCPGLGKDLFTEHVERYRNAKKIYNRFMDLLAQHLKH